MKSYDDRNNKERLKIGKEKRKERKRVKEEREESRGMTNSVGRFGGAVIGSVPFGHDFLKITKDS